MSSPEHHTHNHQVVPGESSAKEYLKFGLVLAGVTLVSFALQAMWGQPGIHDWMRWFMGVFFAVFASFKFAGYRMFAFMFAGYDIIAKRVPIYGHVYPFLELALAALYLTNIATTSRDLFTVTLMAISSVGIYHEIKRRSGIHCACLGNIIKLPLSTVSLTEDVAMGLMALFMVLSS